MQYLPFKKLEKITNLAEPSKLLSFNCQEEFKKKIVDPVTQVKREMDLLDLNDEADDTIPCFGIFDLILNEYNQPPKYFTQIILQGMDLICNSEFDFSKVSYLNFIGATGFDINKLSQLKNLPLKNLTKLTLMNNNLQSDAIPAIIEILYAHPQIKKLSLNNNNLNKDDALKLIRSSAIKNLSEISLEGNKSISKEDQAQLLQEFTETYSDLDITLIFVS